jgi:hypothetical protein
MNVAHADLRRLRPFVSASRWRLSDRTGIGRRPTDTLISEYCNIEGGAVLDPQPVKLTEQWNHVVLLYWRRISVALQH